jgi:hypothetical protein
VRLAQDKVSLIGVMIYIDSNGVEVVREEQLHDKIDANMLPGSCRDFLKL